MTLLNKSPMACKEARNCVRRCLAVMLCCALVFGMTVRTAPRAKAAIVDANIIGMSGASAGSGFTSGGMAFGDPIGACIGQIAMLGSDAVSSIISGYVLHGDGINNKYYGSAGYNLGAACWDNLEQLGGEIGAWCAETKLQFQNKGGIAAGDTITIPVAVQNAIRQWVSSNLDFLEGAVHYNDYVLFGVHGDFALTDVDWVKRPSNPSTSDSYGSVISLGSIVPALTIPSSVDMSQPYEKRIDVMDDFYVELNWSPTGDGVSTFTGNYACILHFYSASISLYGGYSNLSSWEAVREKANEGLASAPVGALSYVQEDHRYYLGIYESSVTRFYSFRRSFLNAIDVGVSPAEIASSIAKSPAADDTADEERVAVVPSDLPMANVNGFSLPIFDDVTASDVVEGAGTDNPAIPTVAPGITAGEITGAITAALPITGSIAGDAVVGEAMAEPDSLGAVFVNKFPFSIPWDVAKVIQLLAAPPATPYWEIDFMQPIAGRVGGFRGSTTIVIDFGEYPIVGVATRWTSTLLFVYALAMGTKKLIWTA